MLTKELEESLSHAVDEAVKYKHEYVTLEHLLYALVQNSEASDVLTHCGADLQALRDSLLEYFRDVLEKMPEGSRQLPELTSTFQSTIQYAVLQAEGSGQPVVDGGNILAAFYQAEQATPFICCFSRASHGSISSTTFRTASQRSTPAVRFPSRSTTKSLEVLAAANEKNRSRALPIELVDAGAQRARSTRSSADWRRSSGRSRSFAVERKNNPLYVGEPGVGKTALAEGLALKISEGNVPDVLKDAKVFALDMGAVLAGTRYRGDFEQRFKSIINELKKHPNAILFIDEIHTIVGAGAVPGRFDGCVEHSEARTRCR